MFYSRPVPIPIQPLFGKKGYIIRVFLEQQVRKPMLRNGYPRLYPPHDWVRQTESALPTKPERIALGQWVSERGDTLTVWQHESPERDRKRFSVVWKPTGTTTTRTIWGSSVTTTEAHVRRTFERAQTQSHE